MFDPGKGLKKMLVLEDRNEILLDAAKKHYLNQEETKDLILLFKIRFPKNDDRPYIMEWANRISNRSDWSHADESTRKALLLNNPKKYNAFKKAEEDGIYPGRPLKVEW